MHGFFREVTGDHGIFLQELGIKVMYRIFTVVTGQHGIFLWDLRTKVIIGYNFVW